MPPTQTLTRPPSYLGYTASAQTAQSRQALPENLRLLLLPLVALFVVVPLQAHGSACGDDFPFHVSSWLDAARQMRSGVLYPHWTNVGAYNAGEPRFTFYPPISWMLGALLVLLFPSAPVTVIFIFLALTTAGFAMYALARQYAAPNAALFCAALYAVNPYMVCNAVERSAFAELLSATWMPLLLLGLLRKTPTVAGLALPLTLLWLTNVPSAVTGVYTFALLFALRLALAWRDRRTGEEHLTAFQVRRLLSVGAAGFAIGVTLPAFYLVPVVSERRFIQAAAAFGGELQVGSNFLFQHNGHPIHDMMLRQVSWIAVAALGIAGVSLAIALKGSRAGSAEAFDPRRWKHTAGSSSMVSTRSTVYLLLGLVAVVGCGLFSPSTPFWRLPELNLLQFPWRLLTVLFVAVALGLSLALQRYSLGSWRLLALLPLLALPLAALAVHGYRRGSVAPHFDQYMAHLVEGGHGFHETPEYTVAGALDAPLRINDPGYWLGASAEAEAPGTTVNHAPYPLDPNFAPGFGPGTTLSQPAPRHLVLNLEQPRVLVLHLRAYPNWQLFRNGMAEPPRLRRTDGLLAVSLPAGPSTVDLRWHRPRDQYLGDGVSLLAACSLLAFVFPMWKRRSAPQKLGR